MYKIENEIIYDIMDVYPHVVGKKVTCWCGKVLKKGTEASIAVLEPKGNDGYHLNHKVVCGSGCPCILEREKAEK